MIAIALTAASAVSVSAVSPFTIAVLPDTQYYCQNNVANPNASLFHDQVNWLLGHRDSLNLKFATHLGDVVNVAGPAGSASGQWAVAESAMSLLKNSTLPFGILPGNHDWTSTAGTGSVEHYRSRFGDQANYFQGKSWFLGYDQRGVNSAELFDTPAGPMLNISLEFNAASPTAIAGTSSDSMAWAQSIINSNRGVPTIISTHNAINPGSGRDGFGQSLFKRLVRDNNQVFMVLNGHYTGNDNEQDLTTRNSYGKVVFERGVDYQNNANGGDGWMNLIEFDPDAKKIRLNTYSPKNNADLSGDAGGAAGAKFGNVGTVRTDYDSQFEREFDFADRFGPVSARAKVRNQSLQQGVNGYTGTTDTKIDQVNAATNYASSATFDVDGETTVGNVSQSLIRFDNVFGSGAGQVAADRDIQRATLRLYVDSAVSNSQGSGLLLHRMLTPWDATSTWDSLSAGISADGLDAAYTEEDSAGASNGSENVKQSAWVELDVTDSLRAMRQGSPNYGWALMPWAGGSNAVILNSANSADPTRRPQLSIDVTADPVVARSFKNGVNGYAGTKDTWVDETAPTAVHAGDPTLHADAGTGADYTTPDEHGLIRFDNLIGSGAAQIPQDDVRVTSAVLVLNVSSAANAEGSGIVLHRMTTNWDESASWTSLGGGIVPGRNATTTPDDTLGEDANVVALKPGRVYADVTASLVAWTEEGASNFGWAVLPTVRGTNAVLLDSAEADVVNRPELVVRYQALAPATWNTPGGGTWGANENWTNAEAPHAVGRTVLFGPANTGPTTVTLDDDRVAGTLRFDSSFGYGLSGPGSLTLQRLAGTGRIQVLRGSHQIDVNLRLKGDTDITVDTNASLIVAGSIAADSSGTLIKRGAGRLDLSTINLQSIELLEGALALQGHTSTVNNVQIGSLGELDLSKGSLLVDYSATSPEAELIALILNTHIHVGDTDPRFAVALLDSSDVLDLSNLADAPADAGALWLTKALRGDSDLSGTVDFADLLTLAQSYGSVADVGWTQGDFDYDHRAGFNDLLALAQNYGASNDLFFADWAIAQSLVPEPGVIGCLAATTGVRRSRRVLRRR